METTRTKGSVVGVVQIENRVDIWVASPTGDSTDSHIYTIPCRNALQAELIAEDWRKAWGLEA
jgi:hypothetical protein